MSRQAPPSFVWLFPVLLLVLLAPGCSRPTQGHPITYWNGSPWTRAEVNGVLGTFLIDTGASMTVLDSEFAERAGVRRGGTQRVMATTGEVELSTGWVRSLHFLGRDHERRFVSIQDLSTFRAPGGIRQAGLIGTDFLLDYTLVFRMESSTALLHPGGGSHKPGLVGFPFELIDGIPTIDLAFGTGPEPLRVKGRIDTGSAYSDESMLHLDMGADLARRILGSRMNLPPDDQTMLRSIAGTTTVRLYDHGPVRLLGREFTVARIAVHDHGQGYVRNDTVLISGNLLARYPHIEFDFPRRRIWVEHARPVLP